MTSTDVDLKDVGQYCGMQQKKSTEGFFRKFIT